MRSYALVSRLLFVLALLGCLVPPVVRNTTDSARPGLYARTLGPSSRGDLVLACLDPSQATEGLSRGYLVSGLLCPSRLILKRVVAVGGDAVEVGLTYTRAAGHIYVYPPIPRTDRQGRPLEVWPSACFELAPGTAFLLGARPARSWDSRFFGPVPVRSLRSRVIPIGRAR